MNEASVRAISLPQARRRISTSSLARKALCSVFERLQVGTLTIQEGGEALNFGRDDNPDHPHACIRVHDASVYSQVLAGGSIGSGEASVFQRLALKLMHLFNRNSLTGSRKNIAAHYDLGNDFFALFLDPSLMYSAAIFPDPEASLEAASEHKLDTICRQLQLEPGDHLLEIGTGWGGMALHAANHYGCRVTTTTLSREQYRHTCERVARAGLEDRITVLCQDYRELEGRFDKLVSIEMIEAVGHQYYQDYFQKCSSLLKPEGLMVIQAITMADQRFEASKNSVDFIQKYVFPGGCLPSLEVISRHVARDTDMQIVDLHDITDHYARTLACWRERFLDKLEQVREQGFDENFQRMWEFYLCYCEGGFRERVIGTVQLTFAKPAYRFSR
jgi:cyclopropane-fatty-acyl-phospholipid synthase